MDLLTFLKVANEYYLGIPATLIFLSVGIILTIKTGFLQIRAFPRFLSFLRKGVSRSKEGNIKTISSLHAMFAAMATSMGMGSIIGPSIAIITGGPGALFWLVAYTFFGGITRFTEVTFAMHTRKKTEEGNIISGPVQYLKLVHKWVANWYGWVMIILFAIWSGLQSNTLASILAKENVSTWYVGLALAVIVSVVLHGGAKRVGFVASKLVPIMFFSYLAFSLLIVFRDISALKHALYLVFSNIFSAGPVIGGVAGGFALTAMRAGIYRSIYITEAGLGTSSIPHSMADTAKGTDQGLLSMYSIFADGFLSFISGMLILVTGMWLTQGPDISSTLVYDVFKMNSPTLGKFVLLVSITLFVTTTVIGNSFNGVQSFASFTKHRFLSFYKIFTILIIFFGASMSVPLIWQLVDFIITFVAIPNVISLAILAFKKPEVLKVVD